MGGEELTSKILFPILYNMSFCHNMVISSILDSSNGLRKLNFGFRRNLNEVQVVEAFSLLGLLEDSPIHPSLDQIKKLISMAYTLVNHTSVTLLNWEMRFLSILMG